VGFQPVPQHLYPDFLAHRHSIQLPEPSFLSQRPSLASFASLSRVSFFLSQQEESIDGFLALDSIRRVL
jgi:hypothetical protein